MQRTGPHAIPPIPNNGLNQNNVNQQPGQQQSSPALLLARRISREQGKDQARKFLIAMEPFLAPYERQSIAEQLGIPLAKPMQNTASASSSYQPPRQHQNYAGPDPHPPAFDPSTPPFRQEQNYARNDQAPPQPQYAPPPPPPPPRQQSPFNPQLLMQLLGQMTPGNAAANMGGGGMNPAMLAQLLGQMNQR